MKMVINAAEAGRLLTDAKAELARLGQFIGETAQRCASDAPSRQRKFGLLWGMVARFVTKAGAQALCDAFRKLVMSRGRRMDEEDAEATPAVEATPRKAEPAKSAEHGGTRPRSEQANGSAQKRARYGRVCAPPLPDSTPTRNATSGLPNRTGIEMRRGIETEMVAICHKRN